MTDLTENQLKHEVLRLSRLQGWTEYHQSQSKPRRPVRVQGQSMSAGWPDIFLVRDGVFIWLELKQEDGILSPDQYRWSVLLHPYCHTIRPSDLTSGRVTQLLA